MLFAQGKVAMMYMGTWLNSEIKGNTPPGFEMDVFRFPSIPGGKGIQNLMVIGNCPNIVIPAGAQNTELAVEWLKFISSKKMVQAFVEQTTMLNGMRYSPMPAWAKSVRKVLEGGHVVSAEAYWQEEARDINANLSKYMQEGNTLWFKFFAGEMGPETYLDELIKLRKKAWDQLRKFGK